MSILANAFLRGTFARRDPTGGFTRGPSARSKAIADDYLLSVSAFAADAPESVFAYGRSVEAWYRDDPFLRFGLGVPFAAGLVTVSLNPVVIAAAAIAVPSVCSGRPLACTFGDGERGAKTVVGRLAGRDAVPFRDARRGLFAAVGRGGFGAAV